jgi:hypothetical protein
MGLGMEEGFVGIMGSVSRNINKAVPTSLNAPAMRAASDMRTIAQPLASSTTAPLVQMMLNDRVIGEVMLPTISRGLATQKVNLTLARGLA